MTYYGKGTNYEREYIKSGNKYKKKMNDKETIQNKYYTKKKERIHRKKTHYGKRKYYKEKTHMDRGHIQREDQITKKKLV